MNSVELLKYTMATFIVVALGSFALSLNGFDTIFNEEGASFLNSALASVVACVSSVLIFVGWKWLFHSVEVCDTPKSLSATMAIGLVMLAFVFSVSTVPGAVGIGGQKALTVHVQSKLMQAEGMLEAHVLYSRSVASMLPELAMDRDRFWEKGQAEFKTGAGTGHPGPGAVADSQKGISKRLGALIVAVEEANSELADQARKALKLLEKARRAIAREKNPAAAMDKLAPYADELRSLFVQMKSRDVAGMLERVMDALPNEIDSRITWARSEELRRRQKAIIAQIREELEATTERMAAHLAKMDALKVREAFELERITSMKATFIYWDELIMIWLTSMMIDSFGYLVLCLLLIQLHWLDQERQRAKLVSKTTVEEIRTASDALKFAGKLGGPEKFMDGIEDRHYGQIHKGHDHE